MVLIYGDDDGTILLLLLFYRFILFFVRMNEVLIKEFSSFYGTIFDHIMDDSVEVLEKKNKSSAGNLTLIGVILEKKNGNKTLAKSIEGLWENRIHGSLFHSLLLHRY
jgi:hypothetical protein